MIFFNLFFLITINSSYSDFLQFSFEPNDKTAENLLMIEKNSFVSTKLFKYYFYNGNIKYSKFFLDKLPDSRESLFLQAKYYIKTNQKEKAIPILKRLIFEYSEIKAFYLYKQIEKIKEINSENIKIIEKIIEINPYYIATYKDDLINYYKNDLIKLKNIFEIYLVYYPIEAFSDILLLKKTGFSKIKYFYFLDKIVQKNKDKKIKEYYKNELFQNFHFIVLDRLKILLK